MLPFYVLQQEKWLNKHIFDDLALRIISEPQTKCRYTSQLSCMLLLLRVGN
jgi:hypothetical protein